MGPRLRDLIRPGVSLAVGLSALSGHVLATGTFGRGSLSVCAGTFALSGAVSVLNQVQEIERDRRMQRTKNRPLASGRMSANQGALCAAVLLAGAVVCLWPLLGWIVLPVLLLVLGLYNGLYTLMKPHTGWAMIPGALCGSLPLWIGWVAGGGGPVAVEPVFFVTLYFTWQMPHFWMLAEVNAADYAAAGFPIPANSFSGFSRQAIPRVWALALALLGGMAPLFGIIQYQPQASLLTVLCPVYAALAILAGAKVLRLGSDVFLATVVMLAVVERLAG